MIDFVTLHYVMGNHSKQDRPDAKGIGDGTSYTILPGMWTSKMANLEVVIAFDFNLSKTVIGWFYFLIIQNGD